MPYQIQLYNAKTVIYTHTALHSKCIYIYSPLDTDRDNKLYSCETRAFYTSSTVENCYRKANLSRNILGYKIFLLCVCTWNKACSMVLCYRNIQPVKWFIWGGNHLKSSLATFSHNKWSTSSIIMY